MKRPYATTTVLVTLAFTAVAHQAKAKDCETDATNMAEIRQCMYDEAVKPLDKTYNDLLQHVRGRNRDAADQLAAAEKSWAQFRDDTCEYVTSTGIGGYSYPDDTRINCFLTFMEARVKMLQYYRKQFDQSNAKGNQ